MNDLRGELAAQELAMRSAGAMAYVLAELDALEARLRAPARWRPARRLLAELDWVRGQVERLQAQWGRKLAVAIVGPSGAGKSTLLNALARREISPTGLERPTTRQVVVYAASRADAEGILDGLREEQLRVHEAPHAPGLEHLTLVDTPDTNTTPANQELLHAVLDRVDILVALFPAHNPKMQDNIAFLEPYVRHLPAGAAVAVLNKVDRVPKDELDEVVGDFRRALGQSWGRDLGRVYLVSARGALDGADYPPGEEPLNALNEFDALQAFLFDTLNRAQQVVDRRLAHAEHLVDLLDRHCREALADTADARREAEEELAALTREAERTLAAALETPGAEVTGGPERRAALQAMLAQRWWGPVGWLLTVWALLMRGAAFLSGLGRADRPLIGLGVAERAMPRPAIGGAEAELAASALEGLYARRWPPVGDMLVRAGFEPGVRDASLWREGVRATGRELVERGGAAYRAVIERLAGRLSVWPLQVLLNLPVLGMLGWVAYETVGGLFLRRYLPADYFRQAGISILAVWLLSFALLQTIASLAGGRSLRRRVAASLAGSAGEGALAVVADELRGIRALEADLRGRRP